MQISPLIAILATACLTSAYYNDHYARSAYEEGYEAGLLHARDQILYGPDAESFDKVYGREAEPDSEIEDLYNRDAEADSDYDVDDLYMREAVAEVLPFGGRRS